MFRPLRWLQKELKSPVVILCLVPSSLFLDRSPWEVLFFELGTVVPENKVAQAAPSNPGCH